MYDIHYNALVENNKDVIAIVVVMFDLNLMLYYI